MLDDNNGLSRDISVQDPIIMYVAHSYVMLMGYAYFTLISVMGQAGAGKSSVSHISVRLITV